MEQLNTILHSPAAVNIVKTGIAAVILFIIYKILYILFLRIPRLTPQTRLLLQKIIKYLFVISVVLYALDLFNINVTAILGAAGIAGVAIGFAAQTSFSNIISGFFLLSDKALKIGDYITVGDISGIVDSIDMLSVKVHTLDNQMVRIPNETIIKSNMINTSAFEIRRLTIPVSIGYDTDLEQALKLLLSVPQKCPLVLTDPAPSVYFDTFADSGIGMVLAVWFHGPDRIAVKNAMFIEIKKLFDKYGIVIPFPQRDMRVTGSLHIAGKENSAAD